MFFWPPLRFVGDSDVDVEGRERGDAERGEASLVGEDRVLWLTTDLLLLLAWRAILNMALGSRRESSEDMPARAPKGVSSVKEACTSQLILWASAYSTQQRCMDC